MHDIHPKTVEILPLFLQALEERGYSVVQLVPARRPPFGVPLRTASRF
jgi:hypothetical protein